MQCFLGIFMHAFNTRAIHARLLRLALPIPPRHAEGFHMRRVPLPTEAQYSSLTDCTVISQLMAANVPQRVWHRQQLAY